MIDTGSPICGTNLPSMNRQFLGDIPSGVVAPKFGWVYDRCLYTLNSRLEPMEKICENRAFHSHHNKWRAGAITYRTLYINTVSQPLLNMECERQEKLVPRIKIWVNGCNAQLACRPKHLGYSALIHFFSLVTQHAALER